MYDISKMGLDKTSLARNCRFKYIKEKGERKYDPKEGELKIESFSSEVDD